MRTCLHLLLACCLLMVAAGERPTLHIIGDSTVRNQTPGQKGWGEPLAAHFDPARIEIVNRAIGGRSSRTFLTEGRWDAVSANLKAGDFVLMQFGHNDGGPVNEGRARASIKGIGDESQDIIRESDGKPETVRTYGWYLRKYIADTKAKGATPVVLSPIPRNIWKDGKIGRNDRDYGLWSRQVAEESGAVFIDLNALVAQRLEELGQEKTAALFAPGDHTHPTPEGAELNAAVLAAALRGTGLGPYLLPEVLWIPRIFSDHMVLQRDTPNPLWGTSTPGAEVTATIAGWEVATTAGPDGRFRLELPALPAGGPHVLEVTAEGFTRRISDILVGEVWLCSGQSNMDFTLAPTSKRAFSGAAGWEKTVAEADHPSIREFKAEWKTSEEPKREIEGSWRMCTPDTAGDFSAVAYHFAVTLRERVDVPVGLITCTFGASTAEAWISGEKLASDTTFKPLLDAYWKKFISYRDDPLPYANYGLAVERWVAGGRKRKAPPHPDPSRDQHHPSVLFNGMIAPIIPFGIRGALWYQGESNVNTRGLYAALQKALIDDWRGRWNRGDFPFYFVQLASYRQPVPDPAPSSLAEMREAQATALSLPNTGMAVTIDIGDADDIHPRNKHDVGRRLALLALARTYGKNVVPCGPLLKEAEIDDGRIFLHFETFGSELMAKGDALEHFAIAGDDRKFRWAKAVIEGNSVVVSSPEVPHPAFVRYAWADHPSTANLTNSGGLPAAPFRTDP